jgi:hypothetical protein
VPELLVPISLAAPLNPLPLPSNFGVVLAAPMSPVSVGIDKKISGAKPPEKKIAKPQPPVKQGLFKKGFLNPRRTASVTPVSPRESMSEW